MGEVQLRHLAARDDVEVCYVVNPDVDRARGVVEDIGIRATTVTDDYDRAITDPAVNAVWLVSPNAYHGAQSIAALEAGHHVFCEKPPATRFSEYRRQIELDRARSESRTLVDYILYFNPMERQLREAAAAGDFGTIYQMQVNYRHPVNISGDKSWKLKKSIMGDALGMGINHAISAIYHVMSPQSPPVSVFATCHDTKLRGFEVPTVWNILIRFETGATGICLGNIDINNGYDLYHNIAGTKGGFVFDSLLDHGEKIRYWSEAKTGGEWVHPLRGEVASGPKSGELAGWPSDLSLPDSGNVVHHQTGDAIDHFLNCIKEGIDSPLSFAASSPIAEIGWAAQISAATGREVALPLSVDEATQVLEK
jgi:predicted dehydrogenase